MTTKFETTYGTVGPSYFSCTSSIWPYILNHPPSTFLPTAITNMLQEHPDPLSVSGFQAHVKDKLAQGYDKIEVVSREVLETAKGCLSNAQSLLWQMDNWFYKGAKVLNQTSVMNSIGAALITIGALGTYFTPSETDNSAEKNKKIRYLSYASIVTGLALVALSTYRINSIAHYINHISTKLPQ